MFLPAQIFKLQCATMSLIKLSSGSRKLQGQFRNMKHIYGRGIFMTFFHRAGKHEPLALPWIRYRD